MTFKEKIETYAPRSRGQLFLTLFLAGILALYFASGYISEQIGQDVEVSPFLFLLVLAIAIFLLVWLVTRLVTHDDVIGAEQWVTVVLVMVGIISLFYFFPGMIPSAFKGSMTEIHSMIGGIVSP